jgi:hypothetical protein
MRDGRSEGSSLLEKTQKDADRRGKTGEDAEKNFGLLDCVR